MTQPTVYALDELNLETSLGATGQETRRDIPVIDFSDFDRRRAEITDQLWQAATGVGFFQVKNHTIPLKDIQQAFALEQVFFNLPKEKKQQWPLKDGLNSGWEYMAQVRPSTGTADRKESYQITLPHMSDLWPDKQELPDFQTFMLQFEAQCRELGMQILSCFATRLGFDEDFFTRAHNPQNPEYQSTLRLLHDFPQPELAQPEQARQGSSATDDNIWRAGAHTDFDCLTLVFQQSGQGGLQVCPGKEAGSNAWTSVIPQTGVITCNIGDMLMRWSDDKLKSTLHRVRMPTPEEASQPRYSLAYFCQADKNVLIQGPEKKYPAITARDYMKLRLSANFAASDKSQDKPA